MHSWRYLTAAAIVGVLVFPHAAWASPLARSLHVTAAAPLMADDLILNVHGWHCAQKKGWYQGHKVWHRHRRACEAQYDDDYYDDDYYVYRHRTSPGVYINPGASIRLHLGGQGDWD
jgi:hypothetical protein